MKMKKPYQGKLHKNSTIINNISFMNDSTNLKLQSCSERFRNIDNNKIPKNMNLSLKNQIFTTGNTKIKNALKISRIKNNVSKKLNINQSKNEKQNTYSKKKYTYYRKVNNSKKLLPNKSKIINKSLYNLSKSTTKKNNKDNKTFYNEKFSTIKNQKNKKFEQITISVKRRLNFKFDDEFRYQTCKNKFHKKHFSFLKNSAPPNEKTSIIQNINKPNIFLYKNFFKKYNTKNILGKRLIKLNFHLPKQKKILTKNIDNKKYKTSKNFKKSVDKKNINKDFEYQKNLKLLARESDKRINTYNKYFKLISNVINEITDLTKEATNNCEKSTIKENYDSSSIKLIEIENKNNIFDNKTIRDQYYKMQNNCDNTSNEESSYIASSINGEFLRKMLNLSKNLKSNNKTIFQLNNSLSKKLKNNNQENNDVFIQKSQEINNYSSRSESSLTTIKNSGVSMTIDKSKKDNIIVNKTNVKENKKS